MRSQFATLKKYCNSAATMYNENRSNDMDSDKTSGHIWLRGGMNLTLQHLPNYRRPANSLKNTGVKTT